MLAFYLAELETEEERAKMTQLYTEHRSALYYIALKLTRDPDLAEDAVHNTFIEVINRKEKILDLDGGNFRRWGVVVVGNKARDILRDRKHFADMPDDAWEAELMSEEKSSEEQTITHIQYERLRERMKSLDERTIEVIEMKYVIGLSYKEIGELENMSAKQIDGCLTRAKTKLHKLITEENDND
jgi:RNA polymerase sigma-70 factor (ECF subfamily)